jgi:hypothetical protein
VTEEGEKGERRGCVCVTVRGRGEERRREEEKGEMDRGSVRA